MDKYYLPWFIKPCGCSRIECNKCNIVASASFNEISGNCVVQGGWANLSKDLAQFIVDCVNDLKPKPLGFHPLPWHTEPCFSERKTGECWCFEILDNNDEVVISYGEIDKDLAIFIVEKVNEMEK